MKRTLISYIPPLLLACAITFSDRTFALGSIDASWARQLVIRWEDIVIAVLAIFLLLRFFLQGTTKIRKLPLFTLFPAWILLELISSLVNAMLGYLVPARIFFYTLKASEYAFIFYYIFYFIHHEQDVRILMRGWLIFIWIHLAYIFYQFVAPTHYGIWLIGENGNFNVGAQFLVLALYSLSYFLFFILTKPLRKRTKIVLGMIYLTPIIGIFTAGIKAGAVAGVVSILIILAFYLGKITSYKALKQLGSVAMMLLVILVVLRFAVETLPYDFLHYRTFNVGSYFVSLAFRANIWQDHFLRLLQNPLHVFIGRGGADPYAEASHNQFVRNLTAGGIIGSVIFFLLIAAIFKDSFGAYKRFRDPLTRAFAVALFSCTAGMLIMGISGESFMIVRPAEHFWYFAGMAYAMIVSHKGSSALKQVS